MNQNFSSATSAVLLNGTPRKNLQLFKRSEARWSPFTSPLCGSCWLPTVTGKPRQRASATKITNFLRIKQWLPNHLVCWWHIDYPWGWCQAGFFFFLKSVINTVTESTGLRVNFQKSMMLPINMIEEILDLLARTFGCSKGLLHMHGLVCTN
jgi:hypothetical protein